jgi:hypothetical protein
MILIGLVFRMVTKEEVLLLLHMHILVDPLFSISNRGLDNDLKY